ncbi:MAG: acyl-CoA dehydrogenase family protein [Porticoccaceae bacterium]
MNNKTALDNFHTDIAGWLDARYPAVLRPLDAARGMPPETVAPETVTPETIRNAERHWQRLRAEQGWLALTWPREYGGAGLDREQARVLAQELRRVGVRPPPISAGLSLLGPVLLQRGTPEQKLRHLPGIARDAVLWCQGYSEPGAGSDLASLTTRAVLDGDHFVVDGQKIWTPHADKADWMFCLVRTDPDAPQHQGISFLLIDMKTPGISVAPIRLVSGPSAFCQTFFDQVRVPKENLLGKLGEGWTIAKQLLQYERQTLGSIGRGDLGRAQTLPELAKQELGSEGVRIADSVLRTQVAQCELDAGRADAPALASAAKARASDVANLIGREAIQMFGGIGMTDEEEIGFFMKRARAAETTLGDGAYHRDRFATLNNF